MRFFYFLILLVYVSSQIFQVSPMTQVCSCQNLYLKIDCEQSKCCNWENVCKIRDGIDLFDSGNCQNNSGIVLNSFQNFCTNRIKNCAETFGCAYINNICTSFSSCESYISKTNLGCQLISSQCTTDGITCIPITSCPNYSKEQLCKNNAAISGAKQCKWITNNSGGQCVDLECDDAPTTFRTQSQCQNWIDGCQTTGQGCAKTLAPCNTYTNVKECQSMIGSDGQCTTNNKSLQSGCRPIVCSDAPQDLTSNSQCQSFLKGCVTNGKGCVQFLIPCRSYSQTQGCEGLIGNDGPCKPNSIQGSSQCQTLTCSDAPLTSTSNKECSNFLAGCITNGQGCTKVLGLCSQYTGTTQTCQNYIGKDGACKGNQTTPGPCQAKLCEDAPVTMNTNYECNLFLKDCVTTGSGCTNLLKTCGSYQGTAQTCLNYIGSDGNCTAPSNQTVSAACVAKSCSGASTNIKTNEGCRAYSYLCITNGQGCISQGSCEESSQLISCEGMSYCSVNKICLNRSSCQNYLNKSQCLSNQQQYNSGGQIYLRDCIWKDEIKKCENNYCYQLPLTLNSDTQCSIQLKGCLTKGQGCVDINEPCSSYSGLTAQCETFKGNNGTSQCTQLTSVIDPSKQCVEKNKCSQASTHSLYKNIQANCNSFLRGCFFDGLDNCTNGDCYQYFGTQTYCGSINTAISLGQPQKCWKIININIQQTSCIPRECDLAPETYNTDKLCDTFLSGCISKGKLVGGCQAQFKSCSQYIGTLAQCLGYQIENKQCSKTTRFCRELICSNKIPPSSSQSIGAKGEFCQSFTSFARGHTCQVGSGQIKSCVDPAENSCNQYVALGSDQYSKAKYCNQLKLPGNNTCGYTKGDYCQISTCDIFNLQDSLSLNIQICQNLVIDGTIKCGLLNEKATSCSVRTCEDIGINSNSFCLQYNGQNCNWHSDGAICYSVQKECQNYKIPNQFINSEIQKALFCSGIRSTNQNHGCAYINSVSTTYCSQAPEQCAGIGIPSQITNYSDRIKFCQYQKLLNGLTGCSYQASQTACSSISPCSAYNSFDNTDLSNQKFCQQLKDQNGNVCSFKSVQQACADPSLNCSDYITYGVTISENQQLCSRLKTISQIQCGSITGGLSNCKNLSCDDIKAGQSLQACSSYNINCTFDGQDCVPLYDSCSQYTAQSSGQGQQYNCSLLKQINGTKCGWSTGIKCSTRACSQLIVGATFQSCVEYGSACQYDGKNCIDQKDNCQLYQPNGQSDQDKILVCKRLISKKGKCVFIVGGSSCIDIQDSCNYKLSSTNSNELSLLICSLLFDSNGVQCGYISGEASCSKRFCEQAQMADSDFECNSFLRGCEQDSSSYCSAKSCKNAPKTFTKDSECLEYQSECFTNGHGCLDRTEPCSSYYGTKQLCETFHGNNIRCTNLATADTFTPCMDISCESNTTSQSDLECIAWYNFNPEEKSTCVWNGNLGCIKIQSCSQYIGTIDSCSQVTAKDGPCFGTSSDPAQCLSNSSVCINAPKSFNTDEQCKIWGSACMTNGQGCIVASSATCSSIITQSACSIYKLTEGLQCDLADQCSSSPLSCMGFKTASECNNNYVLGSKTKDCGWDVYLQLCMELTCELLPVTLTTDFACSNALKGCTTNRAGCVKLGNCSTYDKFSCGNAIATDIQKSCIWKDSKCRPIQCSDNKKSKTDVDCQNYLQGCRTTGQGCSQSFSCSVFSDPYLCYSDSSGYPCLWYRSPNNKQGSCIKFAQCTDLTSSSHQDCQAANKNCTTNGTTCIGITNCSKIQSYESCVIGIDGTCGWLPAQGSNASSCALFTSCSVASGTNEQCQTWSPKCISDGTICIERSMCWNYQTSTACANNGTDGNCVWVASGNSQTTGYCRVRQCSDATTDIITHKGCVAFLPQCTTSGTGCIAQSQCSQYLEQAGCVQGTDGVCFWEKTSTQSFCRLKQCQDVQSNLSSLCASAIPAVNCVSNGINCIPKSVCQDYTSKEACLGGGLYSPCAFIPSLDLLSPNQGACIQFDSCQSASNDEVTCNSKSDSCYFTQTPLGITQCLPHTCQTKAIGSVCQPVPSWDLQTYQICVQVGNTCIAGEPVLFKQESCFRNTLGTHSWNPLTNTCQICQRIQQIQNQWEKIFVVGLIIILI